MAANVEAATSSGHDFVELNEDLSYSPLWNRDLAPTNLNQRTGRHKHRGVGIGGQSCHNLHTGRRVIEQGMMGGKQC